MLLESRNECDKLLSNAFESTWFDINKVSFSELPLDVVENKHKKWAIKLCHELVNE